MAVTPLLSSAQLSLQPGLRTSQGLTVVSSADDARHSTSHSAKPEFASCLKAVVQERAGAQRVVPERTPISSGVAMAAIRQAFAELSGESLDSDGSAILTAQWAHETGNGASMFNYNFGGIKGIGPSGLTVAQRTREGYGKNERRVTDEFRAYNNVEEGARDYVHLLLTRYGDAVTAARQGDASGFVRGLRARGYFTGDPEAYERSIVSIARGLGTGSLQPAELSRGTLSKTLAKRVDWADASSQIGLGEGDGGAFDRNLLLAPQPRALLGADGGNSEGSQYEYGSPDISAARALAFADELARSAIQIATEDESLRRANKGSSEL